MKKEKIFKIILISVLLSQFLLKASPAQALGITYPKIPGVEAPQEFTQKIEDCKKTCEDNPESNECKTCKAQGYIATNALPFYLKYAYYFLIWGGGIACFAVLIWGGISYILGQISVSVEQTKGGRRKISGAFLGLLIIFSSYLIVQTLSPHLLIFEIEKPTPPQAQLPKVPKVRPEEPQFVEVPFGGLIENVKEQAEIVRQEATDLWYITSKKGAQGTPTITETSICLNVLIENCDCGIEDTEGCYLEDDQCKQDEDFCEEVDPCDYDYPGDKPTPFGVPVKDLCNSGAYPTGSDALCVAVGTPNKTCLDDSAFNDLETDNLREAVDKIQALLRNRIEKAKIERQELLIARRDLQTRLLDLELAEAAMNFNPSSSLTYQNWAGIQEKKTERIWGYLEPKPPQFESPSQGQAVTSTPDNQGQCPTDITPSCTRCENELFCYGNNYRCAETDQIATGLCDGNDNCTDPPPVWEQLPGTSYDHLGCYPSWERASECSICCVTENTAGCKSPRTCDDQWFSQQEYREKTGSLSLEYNGQSFTIPSGGVYFCGSNVFGCVNEKCR